MSKRELQPELLDQLPPGDPVAARIHRDILRYNRMLGNFEWIRRVLSESLQAGDRVLEIAAGEGRLLAALSQDGPPAQAGRVQNAEPGLGVPSKSGLLARAGRVAAFDAICPRPENCPEQVEWTVCRAEDFADYGEFDVILVCHFLHQLPPETLRQLGQQLAGARLILAAETRRHPLAAGLCRASRLIGFSAEGIGDGLKSIRAGFRSEELKELLELDAARWRIKVEETLLGSYRLIAEQSRQP